MLVVTCLEKGVPDRIQVTFELIGMSIAGSPPQWLTKKFAFNWCSRGQQWRAGAEGDFGHDAWKEKEKLVKIRCTVTDKS